MKGISLLKADCSDPHLVSNYTELHLQNAVLKCFELDVSEALILFQVSEMSLCPIVIYLYIVALQLFWQNLYINYI